MNVAAFLSMFVASEVSWKNISNGVPSMFLWSQFLQWMRGTSST
jgi:hypothetical protein